MENINYEDILKILKGYATQGAKPEQLADLFHSLSPKEEDKEKEERTKEEKETIQKILSFIGGLKSKDDDVTAEVRRWVRGAKEFTIGQIYNELCIASKPGKDLVRHALAKMCEESIIESLGKKTGQYRKIVSAAEIEEQAWWDDDLKPVFAQFPLGVHDYAKIFPGNIILLEGQKSQGKSSFAIDFARLNYNLFPDQRVLYQNVEMADSEIKDRIRQYVEDNIWTSNQWRERIKFVRNHGDWWDLILPDGLNIVDYLIEYKEPYLLAEYVWQIHKKLKDGIALVVVQRDPFKPYPAGGRATRDIPRLILSLIHHVIKLEDVKTFWESLEHNPTGMIRKYKKVRWWKFLPQGDWQTADDEKYEGFVKEKR